jgi:glycerophosphoryl diester phosphodiesterase
MKPLFVLIVCCIYFVFIWKWKKKPQEFYIANRLFLWGHRGSPEKKTENTLSSFKKAIEQGADGLEFDVRCTKDKQAVVFHDKGLYRLAGINKNIKDMTYEELQKIHLIGEEKIPLLDDLARIIKKTGAINIEIKSDSLFHGYDAIGPVVSFIKKNNLYKKCIVSCFNPLVLIKLKIKTSRVIIGYLYVKNVPLHAWHNVFWMRCVRPESLHLHHSLIESWPAKWAKKQNLKISTYTVNDKRVYKKIKKLNMDGIFTDNIEYLK